MTTRGVGGSPLPILPVRARRRRARPRWALTLALAATFVAVEPVAGPIVSTPPIAEAAPRETFHAAAGPLGPISVIGDSVLLGSVLVGPTLSDHLAARGWGPIRVRAGEGYNTGVFGGTTTFKTPYWIQAWRQQGWDPADVVVNLGANDSGSCQSSVPCAYNAIMHVVNTIGPGHRIWWPKITRFPFHQAHQDAWNAALDQVAAERDDFFTWDWPAVMASGVPAASDRIHLTAQGYRMRSEMMAREITADLAFARRMGTDAALPAAIGDPSDYVALTPERVLDTRDARSPVEGGDTLQVELAEYVPAGATAVAVNLTTDASQGPGYLSAHPCGRKRREVSNVNHPAGVPRGALAIVPLPADGRLCIYSHATSHVIVDLQGAFVPSDAEADPDVDTVRFTPLATPQRLLDTRQSGRVAVTEVNVPANATAVAVNLTATQASAPGWLKAFACGGDEPFVSNVNYLPGESVAGAAIVPVSAGGTICVRSSEPADVIVDITGSFTSDGELRFVPADPTRVLDTRNAIGGWSPIQGGDQVIDVRAVPAGARAVTGTLTIVAPLRDGWLAAYGCGDRPPTSSVNSSRDQVMANAVTTGVDADGRICVLTSATATHSLLDVTGWWTS